MPPSPAPRSFLRHRLATALWIAILAAAADAAIAARVVAIGDVHGDLPAYEAVLRAAGVLDARGAWIAGDAVVVQLGDLIDRGPQMKGALDYVMALEKKAASGRGKFVQLIGNHEVMNMVGDLRYVAPENFAEFADSGSERRRAKAWGDFQKWQQARARTRAEVAAAPTPEAEEAWRVAHPPGLIEHREAFGPSGKYGRWLRSRPALFALAGTLFLHGGVSPALAGHSIDEIDRRVHQEIALFDELRRDFVAEDLVLPYFDLAEMTTAIRAELTALDAAEASAKAAAETAGKSYTSAAATVRRRARFETFLGWGTWSIFAADGPTWFRGYAKWTDPEGEVELAKLRQAFGVERIVVGHTPQPKGTIQSRFDGAVYLIDTGMLSSYVEGGRGSALEIDAGTVTAIYPGGERQVLARASAAPSPAPAVAAPAPAAKAPAAPTPAAPAPASASTGRPFLGPDGAPLPFATDEALLAFLRDAPVIDTKHVGEGVTAPRRLTLEKDGVRARAIFRDIDEKRQVADVGAGRRELNFHDYYAFEPAAYRLALVLGLDRVPPADLRRHHGELGSVQIWIEKAMTEGKRRETGAKPPSAVRWSRQLQTLWVWDALVGNTDRNQGNWLFGPNWEIWFIDHTRSFRRSTDLIDPERISMCPRGLFEKLRTLSDDQVREPLRGLLSPAEITSLLERRKKLVALIEERIRAKGEAAVLFDSAL